MKWMVSYYPCHRSSGSRIGLRMAALALGFASGKYSNHQVNTTALGLVTGPFNNLIVQHTEKNTYGDTHVKRPQSKAFQKHRFKHRSSKKEHMKRNCKRNTISVNVIAIKLGFSCVNIRQVPREVLKTEAGDRGFQHLPRDLVKVNALKNHV